MRWSLTLPIPPAPISLLPAPACKAPPAEPHPRHPPLPTSVYLSPSTPHTPPSLSCALFFCLRRGEEPVSAISRTRVLVKGAAQVGDNGIPLDLSSTRFTLIRVLAGFCTRSQKKKHLQNINKKINKYTKARLIWFRKRTEL